MIFDLPTDYTKLNPSQRRAVREQYIELQKRKCMYCGENLYHEPSIDVMLTDIDLDLFPSGFLDHPIHLQHNHETNMTEGAIHARCNAVLWQYHGR